MRVQASLRDAVHRLHRYPALETPGYCQRSLRDLIFLANQKRLLSLWWRRRQQIPPPRFARCRNDNPKKVIGLLGR